MEITVENKTSLGFDVRITGCPLVENEMLRMPVMNYVVSRMDNYYDANGLSDIYWKEDRTDTVIVIDWNPEYMVPRTSELTGNVERWLNETAKEHV